MFLIGFCWIQSEKHKSTSQTARVFTRSQKTQAAILTVNSGVRYKLLYILDLTGVFPFFSSVLKVLYRSVHFTCRFAFWTGRTNLNLDRLASVRALLFLHCSQMNQIHRPASQQTIWLVKAGKAQLELITPRMALLAINAIELLKMLSITPAFDRSKCLLSKTSIQRAVYWCISF